MSKRQQRIHERVLRARAALVPLAAELPFGVVAYALLPDRTCVMLMRYGAAVRYRDAAPYYGKHLNEPKWRTLARV